MAFKPVALASASMFALMLSGAAHAQDAATVAPQDEAADIVVTGVRASIVGALNVRKQSTQIVDS
ncbi:hypothetical protein NL460_28000, partial [Klebsiella pneumoniae]|nr:hypothetical protein [Klebsiella pneumoniae]